MSHHEKLWIVNEENRVLADDQLVITKTAQDWTPAQISTLTWFDASDTDTITVANTATNQISQWDDKSGNDNHAFQTNSSRQPTYITISGYEVDFNGTTDVMAVTGDPYRLENDFAAIVVSKWDSSKSWGNMMVSWDSESGANTEGWSIRQRGSEFNRFIFTTRGKGGDANSTTTDNSTDFIGSAYITGNTKKIRHNGTETWDQTVVGTIGTTGSNRSALGAYYGTDDWGGGPSAYLDGKLKEVVVIQNPTLDTVYRIEGYLAWKWGLQSKLPSDHPYKGSAPIYIP